MSEAKRQTWDNRVQSYLAMLAFLIGLGNIWRFPYVIYKNGGGAFLIPYSLSIAFIGIPLFFLEVSIGQFVRRGAIDVWKLVPVMKGIGIGTFVLTCFVCQYYMVIIAWAFLYFFRSMTTGELPWTTCGNWWNTNSCISYEELTNFTMEHNNSETHYSAEEFWNNYVLRKSSGLEVMGSLDNWPLVLCLLVSWIVCYFCTFRGTQSAGKAVYITATLPYLLTAIILIKALTLPGAADGLEYYVKPNMTKLGDPRIWLEAVSQSFFTSGICVTVVITFGSYNRFNEDCYKMSFILIIGGALTSFITGLATFSVLGHLAHIQDKNVTDVITAGAGLLFVSVPTVLALLPGATIWNILFFFMIILLGIDSQFACIEGIAACLVDAYPERFQSMKQRQKLMAVICAIFFISGLIFCMDGGLYVFELYNNYGGSGFALIAFAFFEAIAIGYFYGIDKFYNHVELMIGYKPGPYMNWCIRFISPGLMLALFLFYCVDYSGFEIDGYIYPAWSEAIGWVMVLASVIFIPIWIVYKMFIATKEGTLKERWRKSIEPEYIEHLDRTNDVALMSTKDENS